jgi:hypothetical protein
MTDAKLKAFADDHKTGPTALGYALEEAGRRNLSWRIVRRTTACGTLLWELPRRRRDARGENKINGMAGAPSPRTSPAERKRIRAAYRKWEAENPYPPKKAA